MPVLHCFCPTPTSISAKYTLLYVYSVFNSVDMSKITETASKATQKASYLDVSDRFAGFE